MAEYNLVTMSRNIAKKVMQDLRDNRFFVRRWIPITERLPEENKTVIASTKYGVYPEARYTKENGWAWAYESGLDYWVKLEDVTAWMPLPKPYEPQETEKWNSMHAQITAPKGTFERIFNDTDDDNDI